MLFSSSSNSALFRKIDSTYKFQFLTRCSSILASSAPPTMSNTDEHHNKTQLIANLQKYCSSMFLLVLVCGFRAGSGFLVFPGFAVLFLVVPCFFLVVSGFSWSPVIFAVFLVCLVFAWLFRVFQFFWLFLFFLVSPCFPIFSWCSWFVLVFIAFPGFS